MGKKDIMAPTFLLYVRNFFFILIRMIWVVQLCMFIFFLRLFLKF